MIGIPLAAGAFGWQLDPMFAAAAMSLSSVCVVTNALRLNLFRFDKHPAGEPPAGEAKIKTEKETTTMQTKTLTVEGMMCAHCEAHVKQALEALPGVQSAEASHESGTATVTLSAPVEDAALCHAVEEAGYRAHF